MTDPSLRPAAAYIHGADGPVVVVTGRTAAWLLQYANLARLRVEHRGQDPEIDAVLGGITYCANAWRTSATGSSAGSSLTSTAEAAAPSEWMSTSRAADVLGISDRAVRLAISEKRLPAAQVNGRWRIHPDDVNRYRAHRAA